MIDSEIEIVSQYTKRLAMYLYGAIDIKPTPACDSVASDEMSVVRSRGMYGGFIVK